ncbi:MAG: hypothetical protein HKN70_02715 [Gammaproteobacteria bacterium]|nr:hypothetical protein [Gammaproteobacteria bacterium]
MLRGTASVSIHTHNLPYAPGTPLRLFKAEHGGDFFDITERTSSGSYRVRGSGGEFSEFMIVADVRPTATKVLDKFSKLSGLLSTHQSSIDSTLHGALTTLLASAQADYNTNGFAAAIEALAEFDATIKKATGGEIPDAWRPRGDLTNVAGQLRAVSGTLRYSLSLLANNL